MLGAVAVMRKALAAPILRFLVLGAMIFGLYAAFDERAAPMATEAIVIDAATARQLRSQFEATWRRPPTPAELDGLIADRVVEEAFVREARALGLDRGDAVIRQRLRQKMTFFAEAGAGATELDEAAVRAHFEAEAERFRTPPRVAFEQVYLGPDPTDDDVAAVRAALESGGDPVGLGVATLLPRAMRLAPASVIESAFGRGFFDRLAALEPGVWEGPTPSALGLHLVRITAHEPAQAPPFEAVRDRVESDLRASRAEAQREAFTEALLARYRIDRPDAAAVLSP